MTIPSINRYPRVIIKYCAKCKWQNRALWYLQELLQTFPETIQDISVQPIYDQPGVFAVILVQSETEEPEIVYQRKFKSAELAIKYGDKDGSQSEDYYYEGFPDAKFIKILIRDKLGTEVKLGQHVEKDASTNFLTSNNNRDKDIGSIDNKIDCQDCNLEQ
ncbi:hypothetical protein PICST_28093 [Scheffersomyces stipitis CBS 6054]|uniref:Rdx family-domain-containing protein n=1 Tax=Scheffersomyces stipitis (strain ATCC 58785 / CBS 6054 / NBRC 10063 / NRRL Y-11545) TaxID=322104 RepID=A3GF26_PICST|nr:predicted protein [Scheffersomyces stipitis CBS 6054]EAZ63683.1 hypothetical protein PICST_28093 [Scheffersomyces stipitis CBS 6054]